MRSTKTSAALTSLTLIALAGCAAPSPWLCPRGTACNQVAADAPPPAPRTALGAAAPARTLTVPSAYAAMSGTSSAPASLPMRTATAGGPAEIAQLNAEEPILWQKKRDIAEARARATALASALQTYEKQPSDAHRKSAEDALQAYKESPAVRKFGAVALTLSLAACNSIGSQIADLNAEERDLANRLAVIQEARKANIALVSALQQVQRDGGATKSTTALARCRAAYENASAKVE